MSKVWTAVVVIVLLAFVAPTLSVSFESSTVEFAELNESITLSDSGTYVDASDDAFRFRDNETVLHGGNDLVEGTDYQWNASTGELTRLSGASVPNNEPVTITYAYLSPSENTRELSDVLGNSRFVLTALLFLLAGAGVLALLGRVS